METEKQFLTRTELAQFLTSRGYPIAKSTLDKLCQPSRGDGPPMAKRWLGRPLYEPAVALAWAEARTVSEAA